MFLVILSISCNKGSIIYIVKFFKSYISSLESESNLCADRDAAVPTIAGSHGLDQKGTKAVSLAPSASHIWGVKLNTWVRESHRNEDPIGMLYDTLFL
jgi:hypothetical protein